MNYCKLYIDVQMGIGELQAFIDDNIQKFSKSASIDAIVFQNNSYCACNNAHSSTYPVDRSRYYIEMEPALNSGLEKSTFESAIAQLVIWLRKECEYVVASCEFEDYIVEQTGWNWTPENPLPQR